MVCFIDVLSSVVLFTKEDGQAILPSVSRRSVKNTISSSTDFYSQTFIQFYRNNPRQNLKLKTSGCGGIEVWVGRFSYGGKRVDGVTRFRIGGLALGLPPPNPITPSL